MTRMAVMTLGALVLAVATASAQMINRIEKQTLTLAGAKAVAAAAAAEARKNNVGGSVAVVDDGGNLLYLERLDNTFAASAPVACAKARTAAIFRRATKAFEDAIKNGRTSLVAVSEMTPLEGGVPIVVGDHVIGAVGVSGAASADQDEEFARIAAAVIK
jgi:glc operon protein GlcG